MKIKKISNKQGKKIIDSRKPLGAFYMIDNTIYIAIDNLTGDAWTNEFKTLSSCKKWLKKQF